MYQHILLAVALQRWDKPSPHALAARDAAVALAKGAGARLSVLRTCKNLTSLSEGCAQVASAPRKPGRIV